MRGFSFAEAAVSASIVFLRSLRLTRLPPAVTNSQRAFSLAGPNPPTSRLLSVTSQPAASREDRSCHRTTARPPTGWNHLTETQYRVTQEDGTDYRPSAEPVPWTTTNPASTSMSSPGNRCSRRPTSSTAEQGGRVSPKPIRSGCRHDEDGSEALDAAHGSALRRSRQPPRTSLPRWAGGGRRHALLHELRRPALRARRPSGRRKGTVSTAASLDADTTKENAS